MNTFNMYEILKMNNNHIWNGSIINTDELKENIQYKIYSTGEIDLIKGRIYVCIPAKTIIDDKIKTFYNLL